MIVYTKSWRQKLRRRIYECNQENRNGVDNGNDVIAWSGIAWSGDIHDATAAGDVEKVKSLLAVDSGLVNAKDKDGETPLHWAAVKNHKDVAVPLLANKADVNARDNDWNTPLRMAAYNKSTDAADLLRQHGGVE